MPTASVKGTIAAVDLFCGVGGLTHGLLRSGVEVRLGVDIDPSCEYPYSKNNGSKFLLRSVSELKAEDLSSEFRAGELSLFAGCAPCQTFSRYNPKAAQTDDRWWLLGHFSDLVTSARPDFVTMENVPGLLGQEVFTAFVDALEASGYSVWSSVVDCSEYGVPQHRNRLVLLASRHGPLRLISPSEFGAGRVTVREAIGGLPAIAAGSSDVNDRLHRSAALTEINLKRVQASRPGGTWRDWPKELVAACHTRDTGKTFPGVYGRMTWGDPAPTMTTQFYGYGNGRFGHPEQDRAISLREGAILQGFPPDYEFVSPDQAISRKAVGRLIGNAVPVTLGEVIGASFVAHAGSLADEMPRNMG